MKTIFIALTTVAVIGLATPVAIAEPGGGNSWFGLCMAWQNNEEGREKGNAENSTAFQQLQQHAEDEGHDSVEEFCETVPHPGGGPGNGGPGNGGPPDDVPNGPPF